MPLSWLPRSLASPPHLLTIIWNRAAKHAEPCPGCYVRAPRIARMHEQQSGEQAEPPSDGAQPCGDAWQLLRERLRWQAVPAVVDPELGALLARRIAGGQAHAV